MPTQTNELKTVFSVDLRDAEAKLAAYEARLKQIRDLESRVGGGPGGRGTSTVISQAASRVTSGGIRPEIQATIDRVNKNLDDIDRRIAFNKQRADAFAADLAASAVIVAGSVFAVKQFVDVTAQAIETTIEADKANRSLAVSANLIGAAYGDLAKENERFANSLGRTRTETAELTAEISRLAGATSGDATRQNLQRAVADIAVVRGITPEKLGGVLQGANAGDETALRTLGVNSATEAYSRYAVSIGKTAESLNNFERQQAIVNAILQAGAGFAGANEAKMQTLEGTVDRATAAWDNFTESLQRNLATSGPVLDFLRESANLLNLINGGPGSPADKRAQGLTNKQIAQGEFNNPASFNLSLVQGIGAGSLNALFGLPVDAFNLGIGPALRRQQEIATGQLRRSINDRTRELDAEQRLAEQTADAERIARVSQQVEQQRANIERQLDAARRQSRIPEGFTAQGAIKQEQEFQKAAEQARKTQREFQNLLASAREAETGNPFIGLFNDAGNAAQDAFEKFRIFGDDFGNFAAGIAQRAAQARIELESFQSERRAFDLRQEASRLRSLSPDEIGGRPARVSALQNVLGLGQGVADTQINQQLLRSLTLGFITPDRIQQAQQDAVINRLLSFGQRSRGIDGLVARLEQAGVGDFGTFGEEAIAQAKLNLLPSESELFGLVGDDPFLNFQAQVGLEQRARLLDPIISAGQTRVQQAIQRAANTEQLRERANQFALELDTGKIGGGLSEQQRREQFLAVTDQIGIENLDQNLIQARINALEQRSKDEASFREEGLKIFKALGNAFDGGFLVRFGDDGQPIVRIINDAPDKARVGSQPSQADTTDRYDVERSRRQYL